MRLAAPQLSASPLSLSFFSNIAEGPPVSPFGFNIAVPQARRSIPSLQLKIGTLCPNKHDGCAGRERSLSWDASHMRQYQVVVGEEIVVLFRCPCRDVVTVVVDDDETTVVSEATPQGVLVRLRDALTLLLP